MLQRCSLKNGQRDAPTARVSQRLPETRLVTLLLRHTYTHVDRCAATKKKNEISRYPLLCILLMQEIKFLPHRCVKADKGPVRPFIRTEHKFCLLLPCLQRAWYYCFFFLFFFSSLLTLFFFKVLLKGIVTKSTVTEMEKKKAK